MLKLSVVNGPNVNRLGLRETKIYGLQTWEEIWQGLLRWALPHETSLTHFQSNSEGGLIDYLQEVEGKAEGILFNPGALAHTSICLRDCVASLKLPVVEVHLSKIYRREPFRAHSYIADVAQACITGFGADGYLLGLELLRSLLTHDS